MNTRTETHPKPPLALVLKDNPDYVVAWACGSCERVMPSFSPDMTQEEAARLCCLCSDCKSVFVDRRAAQWRCKPCKERASIRRERKNREREKKLFDEAEKVSERDYDGPVFCQDTERFFAGGTDDLCEYFEADEEPLPKYVWAAKPVIGSLDVRDWLEAAEENQELCEDYEWQAVAELEAFVAEWNAKQTMKAYFPDYGRAVLLDGEAAGE